MRLPEPPQITFHSVLPVMVIYSAAFRVDGICFSHLTGSSAFMKTTKSLPSSAAFDRAFLVKSLSIATAPGTPIDII